MPYKPKKPCSCVGCKNLTYDKYCDEHKALDKHTEERPSANKRGYNTRWQKARAVYLSHHPLCAECEKHGRLTPATVVDHIVPHKGDSKLFWDKDNWQPLCKQCHDRKTATEDGGFGRAVKARAYTAKDNDTYTFV